MAFNGGGGRCAFFRTSADHATIYADVSGTTAAAAAADAAMVIGSTVSEDILVQTDFSISETGALNIKWVTTAFNKDVDAFLKAVIPRTSASTSVTKQTLTDETGRSIGGGSSSGIPILALPYGSVEEGGTERLIYGAIGSFKATSGGHTWKGGEWVQLTLEFTSVPCKKSGGLTIAADLLESDMVDVATVTDPVLGYQYYYDRFFLAEAA